ncbi:acyl-CoA/acyl-ACP dehydrogenase [Streptomycetaceae bacterium NBC_01309]
MRFALSDEQHELGSMARRLLADRARRKPGANTPVWGERPVFDRELWGTCAELGLLALGVSETVGGTGGGALELAVVAEEMGAAAPYIPYVPVAIATAVLAASGPGGSADVPALVAEIQAGHALLLPAWDTFAALADRPRYDALRVTAAPAGAGGTATVRVSGQVTVPYGDSADLVVAEAAGPGGARLTLLVAVDQPGVRTRPVDGLDTAEPLAVLAFSDAEADVLAAPAPADPDPVAEAMRVLLAAELVGTGRRALDDAVRYAKERTQFGRPIGSFQALKHMLADRHVQLDAARMLVWLAATGLDEPAAGETGDARAAALPGRTALAAASDAADAATADGLQTHGGIGFTWEQPAHVFLKHARARRALLGSPGRQLDRLAESLLATR